MRRLKQYVFTAFESTWIFVAITINGIIAYTAHCVDDWKHDSMKRKKNNIQLPMHSISFLAHIRITSITIYECSILVVLITTNPFHIVYTL